MHRSPIRKYRFYILIPFLLCISAYSYFCKNNPTDNKNINFDPSNYPGETWRRITVPDSAGWSSQKLIEVGAFLQTIPSEALMVIYDGKILYQYGNTNYKYLLHSCRKSLLSALYGIHVNNGNIDLDKTMGELGIDDKPPSLSDEEKTATVRMLLQARSGIYHPASSESAGMQSLRPERYSHLPGTFWYYNNWDFNALGTIFIQETDKDIFEEFYSRFAIPLGMEDFQVSDCYYSYEEVSEHPAYHFRMTARDMARFGYLFLRRGKWFGKQIIPETWIEESTTSYSDAGSYGGYGYMWWVTVDGMHFPNIEFPNGSYSARGYGGHYIIVLPRMNLVIVHRVNTDIGYSVSTSDFSHLLSLILDAKKY